MTLSTSPLYVLTCRKVLEENSLSWDDYRRLNAEFMHAMRPEELSPWAKALFDRARGIDVAEIPEPPMGPYPLTLP